MPTTTPTLELPRTPRDPGRPAGGGPGGGGSSDGNAVPSVSPARIGVWLLVGAITILFAAFTSTYLVRRNAGDWPAVVLPPVLWLTTAVLLNEGAAAPMARGYNRARACVFGRAARGMEATHRIGGVHSDQPPQCVFLSADRCPWPPPRRGHRRLDFCSSQSTSCPDAC